MNLKKLLNKKRVVKIIIYAPDRRIHTFYEIPKDNRVSIKDKLYIINADDFYLDKELIPTYLYQQDSTEPINPQDMKKSLLSPTEYGLALKTHVAKDILDATKGGMDLATLSVIISAVTLVITGVGLYMLYKNVSVVSQNVTKIQDLIKIIGGVAE